MSGDRKVSVQELVKYANTDLSTYDIAKALGCSPQNVQSRFKRLGLSNRKVKSWLGHKADVISHLQSMVANKLAESGYKKSNEYQLTISLGILQDLLHKIQGKHNRKIDITVVNADMRTVDIQLKDGEKEILSIRNRIKELQGEAIEADIVHDAPDAHDTPTGTGVEHAGGVHGRLPAHVCDSLPPVPTKNQKSLDFNEKKEEANGTHEKNKRA